MSYRCKPFVLEAIDLHEIKQLDPIFQGEEKTINIPISWRRQGQGQGHTQPGRDSACFAPGMCQLDANTLALTMRKLHDPSQRRNLGFFPQPGVLRGDAAIGCDRGSLYK